MMLCRWPSPSYSSLFICFSVSRLGGLGEVSLSCWSPGYTLHKMCLRILHPDCVDGVLSFAACVSHAVKDKSVLADVSWSSPWRSARRSTCTGHDSTHCVRLGRLSHLHSNKRMSHISVVYRHPLMMQWLRSGQDIYSLSVTLISHWQWGGKHRYRYNNKDAQGIWKYGRRPCYFN